MTSPIPWWKMGWGSCATCAQVGKIKIPLGADGGFFRDFYGDFMGLYAEFMGFQWISCLSFLFQVGFCRQAKRCIRITPTNGQACRWCTWLIDPADLVVSATGPGLAERADCGCRYDECGKMAPDKATLDFRLFKSGQRQWYECDYLRYYLILMCVQTWRLPPTKQAYQRWPILLAFLRSKTFWTFTSETNIMLFEGSDLKAGSKPKAVQSEFHRFTQISSASSCTFPLKRQASHGAVGSATGETVMAIMVQW